jgi:hypothetical protein
MVRKHGDTRVTAGRTLIRRYVLALAPAGAGNKAAVTAASVPPLSGGPGSHGSEAAAHALTIADSAGGGLCRNSLAGDAHGDIAVDTAKAREGYRRWMAQTRAAGHVSPDGTRRSRWLMRPLKPGAATFALPGDRSAGR